MGVSVDRDVRTICPTSQVHPPAGGARFTSEEIRKVQRYNLTVDKYDGIILTKKSYRGIVNLTNIIFSNARSLAYAIQQTECTHSQVRGQH